MPIGYWWTVAVVCWGVVCALTRWPRLGSFAAIPALLVSELPFIVGYLLIASTVLAFVDGDLDSPGGAAGAVVALFALAGLVVVVDRSLRAHAALRNAGKPVRPWARILRAPFYPGRLDVVRVRGLAYGDGPRRTLDVYHRRDRPAGVPVLVHFHGGGFYSGNKAREARPLIRHLTSRHGFVCVNANYRLQPHVTLADQVADVRDAIAWVRAHAAEFGAEPGLLFVAGSSAGANLAIRASCEGETGIAGLICRYGYYGDLAPWRHAAHARGARREGHADTRGGRARLRGAGTRGLGPPGQLRRATRRPPRLRHVRVHPVRRGQPGSSAVHREETEDLRMNPTSDQGIGRVAVVTGASSGIGAATARALSARGFRVALLAGGPIGSMRWPKNLGTVHLRSGPTSPTTTPWWRVRPSSELGGTDVLVNNAGIMLLAPFKQSYHNDHRRWSRRTCSAPCLRPRRSSISSARAVAIWSTSLPWPDERPGPATPSMRRRSGVSMDGPRRSVKSCIPTSGSWSSNPGQ